MKKLLFTLLICYCPWIIASQQSSVAFNQPEFSKKIVPDFLFNPLQSDRILPAYKSGDMAEEYEKQIAIKRIRIQGNTVLTKQQILPVVKPFIGKQVSISDLQQLRYQISALYYKQGYINSGVLLPDQEIKQGIVIFRAVEGELSQIHLKGNKHLADTYVLNKVFQGAGKPLNIQSLKQSILLLEQDPLIETIRARLYPSTELGKSELNIEIRERKMYQIILGADNYRSPIIGSERGYINLQHNNITGFSDSVSAQFGVTEGLQDYALHYSIPMDVIRSRFGAYYQNTDARVISEEARDLNIESQSAVWGVLWTYQLKPNNLRPKEFSWGLENSNSYATISGIESENQSTAMIFSTNWLSRSSESLSDLTAGITVGKAAVDSLILNDDAEGTYGLFSFDSIYQKRVNTWSQLLFKSKLQYASKTLLGVEKIALGGAATVRGYRENTLNRDNGFLFNAEWLSRPWFQSLNFNVFSDYAVGWNKTKDSDQEHLLSIGAGFSWQGIKKLNLEVMLGIPLINRPDESENLQDFGLHFGLQYSVF